MLLLLPIMIELRPTEIRTLMYIGERRNEVSVAAGRVTREEAGFTAAQTHGHAAIGEYGFCKMNNLHFDLDYDPRPLPDYDCILGDDDVDVKTITKAHHNLAVAETKIDKPCDKYVLMYWNGPWLEYLGYALPADIFRPENLKKERANGEEYDSPFYLLHKDLLIK